MRILEKGRNGNGLLELEWALQRKQVGVTGGNKKESENERDWNWEKHANEFATNEEGSREWDLIPFSRKENDPMDKKVSCH